MHRHNAFRILGMIKQIDLFVIERIYCIFKIVPN
jgi:hypothetical protein